MSAPHDRPRADELVEAVREFLEADVLGATDGRVRFHTRVAINVLGMVQRELSLGREQERHHAERLEALGFRSDDELATAIRTGALDDRYDEVKASVWASVRDKLLVANPGYLEEDEPDQAPMA